MIILAPNVLGLTAATVQMALFAKYGIGSPPPTTVDTAAAKIDDGTGSKPSSKPSTTV
jgi:hypothetical protein